MDLAGTRGCGSDSTVDRITARIRGALEVLSVDSLSPTLQSSLMLFSPVLRSSVSDVTQHPVTLGNNPGFHVFLFFFLLLSLSVLPLHIPSVHKVLLILYPDLSQAHAVLFVSVFQHCRILHWTLRRATLSCTAERGTQQMVVEGMRNEIMRQVKLSKAFRL